LHGQPRDTLTVRPAIAKRRKERYIPLNRKAQAAVRALLGWSAKRGLRTDSQAPLFQTRRHEGFTVRAIQRLLVALRTQAGLTVPATPHSLRHCFATQLARVANLRTVQLALGHQWLSTTQRYLNPTPGEQRHDLERLAQPRSRIER
jgi:site-specific recombinase XerD